MLFFTTVATALIGSAAASAIGLHHHKPSLKCPVYATSCNNYTVPVDSCCTETTGGLMMATQIWQTGTPSNGPKDKWTIHGLWSDYCWNGAWPALCSPDRMLNNTVVDVLTKAGEHALLKEMNQIWVGSNGTASNADFWEHEWNKHGTCMSTLEPTCLHANRRTKHTDAITFYKTAIKKYKEYDLYKALAAAGIVPSNTKRYLTKDVSGAIQNYYGNVPNIQCFNGALSQIWLYFYVEGTVATGRFIPTNPNAPNNCTSTLTYPVKAIGPGY